MAHQKRPYRLVWTDSCRHTRSFATLEAAHRAAKAAEPCNGVPCKWEITYGATVVASGAA